MPLSFTILLTVGVVLALVIAGRRSRADRPTRSTPTAAPRSCVVVRRFGEDSRSR
ncbi:MAG: hypothetical protein WD826_02115 [Actinomycetota bacterium]